MDIRQLEAFAGVVEAGSFSRAAKGLGLTQPTVSAHVASLESELGCKLLERRAGKTTATDIGKTLYGYAERILALRSQALMACKTARSARDNTIRMAASTIPYQYALPVVTSEFRLKYPAVHFELTSTDSATVAAMVLEGTADLGMAGATVDNAELAYTPFMEDALVVITPSAEPYRSIDPEHFTLEELAAAPFIIREPGSGTRSETEGYLHKLGLSADRLNIVAQMDDSDAINKAVSQGLGISIVSQLSAADYERFGQIRSFELEGKRIGRTIYLVHHKSRPVPPAAEALLRFVTRSDSP